MSGKLISIRVVMTKESDSNQEPWDMVIENSEDIKAYMVKKDKLMFNYQGNIYQAYDITKERFLELVPHLKQS